MASSDDRLMPTERQWFRGREGQINRAFDLGKQQNRYDRDLSRFQFGWDKSDLLKRLQASRTQIPGQYQRRGLATSGIAQRGLIDFNDERTKALTRLDTANYLKEGGFNMVDSQLQRVRDESLSDLIRQRDALRELRASTIRSVM